MARRLAAELGPELRAGIADAAADTGRALQLLRVAGALGVDCADLVPSLAHRLASALLADPSAYGSELHGTLADRPDLRAALLRELDAAAGAAPASVTVLLERAPLELESPEALPYLRMCGRIARNPSGGGDGTGTRDRTGELRAVLAAAGSPSSPIRRCCGSPSAWCGGRPRRRRRRPGTSSPSRAPTSTVRRRPGPS
ncbi:hypothetical protein GTX14_29315 [Streptomyces sp. SID4944]|nr:hypothetical protein [Streptomyces sp. SID4944]